MTQRPVKDVAASVKQRLLNLARERHEDFNFLLSRFAAERFLYRLSQSAHGREFVLKGAMLFHLRPQQVPHRPTHDLDLLGSGSPDLQRIGLVFRDVCRTPVPEDGLIFLDGQVAVEQIKSEDEYLGVRARLQARMGSARIPLQVDVGFGDAVVPAPGEEQLVTLLDLPAPVLRSYPWEAMIAEKFNAMVELGMDNSRMKDYLDLHHLAGTQPFEGPVLCQAVQAAFERRHTPMPAEVPPGLQPQFALDPAKQAQWRAFVRKLRMEKDLPRLEDIVLAIQAFLMPPVAAIREGRPFNMQWPPSGPWRATGVSP